MSADIQYKIGDRVFIISNNVKVQELEIIKVEGEFYTLRSLNAYGGMRLRENRLFTTKDEAYQELNKHKDNRGSGYIRPF